MYEKIQYHRMISNTPPDEDNDDVIESFWLYIFSVFPSFVYYYLLHKLCHEYAKRIYKTAMPYIMIDVI